MPPQQQLANTQPTAGSSMVKGLSHLTFVVRDLDKMEMLLTTIFGAWKVYDSEEANSSLSRERFYVVGELWIAIKQGDPILSRTSNHLAFKIEDAHYNCLLAAIKQLGLEPRETAPAGDGTERSIYFFDYDNHLFELHTGTLDDRLAGLALGQT